MAEALLSDDEVFGKGEALLSDADVFGDAASPPSPPPAASPAPRRGTLRSMPYVAPSDASRGTPATEIRRADQEMAAAADEGKSVLDRAPTADSRVDPMLRQDFVDSVKAELANVPEASRLQALQALAQRQDATGRAAKVLLAGADIENARAREAAQTQPLRTAAVADALAAAPPTPQGPGPAPEPKFPDLEPSLGETAQGTSAPEIAKARLGALALASSDTGLEGMAERAQTLARDFDAEAFAKAHPELGALASGGGQMAGGILNSVSTIMDFAGKMFGIQSRAPDSETALGILKGANSYMPAVGKQSMAEAWDKGEFGSWLTTNLIAQAPQIAASTLSAFVPPLRAVLLPGMGAQTAGQSFAQGDSSLASVLKGGAEIVGEKMPLHFFDRAQAAIARLPAPIQGEFLQSLGKSFGARAGAITGQHVVGAIEEGVTQILQNGVDKYVEDKGKTGLMDGVSDAAVLGALMEGPMSVPHALANTVPVSRAGALGQAFAEDVADRGYSPDAADAAARALLSPDRAQMQVVRVQDMPTTPLTPAQVRAAAAAAAVDSAVAAAPPQGATSEAAPGADGTVATPTPEAREVGGGVAQAPAIATAPQGELADRADALLRERANEAGAQTSSPAPAGTTAGAGGAAAGTEPGGGAAAAAAGAAPAAPAAGVEAGGAKAAPAPDAAGVEPQGLGRLTHEPFKTKGEAIAQQTVAGLAHRTEPVKVEGGWVLAPKPRPATTATAAEDQVNADTLNNRIGELGWVAPDGSKIQVRPVADTEVPTHFRRLQDAAWAAFGIRLQAAEGVPGRGLQFGTRAYVATDALDDPNLSRAVAGHEAFHWLETNDPEAARAMHEGLEQWLLPDAIDRQLEHENKNLARGQEPLNRAGARSEVVANINGAMWIDPKFWQRLYELDGGSIGRRVLYQFLRASAKFARVFAGTTLDAKRFVSDVEQVREVAARVWAQRAQGKGKGKEATQAKAEAVPRPKAKAEERLPGETIKAYAKRVIDTRAPPPRLEEDQDRYFTNPDGAIEVPVSSLLLAKPRRDTDRTGENASKRMAAAAAGELERRPPVTVTKTAGGRYEVVDGNSTVAAARRNGWEKLRVLIEEPERPPPTDWTAFGRASGTLGIPRHEMPQIAARHLQELIEHMRKMGISAERVVVPADELKPTQAEYSPAKVASARKKASDASTSDISLISADGHVIDGHHRWMDKAERGVNVKAVRFNAPAQRVIDAMWEFEHVDVDTESESEPEAPVVGEAYKAKIEGAAAQARSEVPETIVERAVRLLESTPPVTRRGDVDAITRLRLESLLRPVIERGMAANASFERTLADIASSLDADYKIAPVKTIERAVDKLFEDELATGVRAEPGWLKDVIRGSIIVDTVEDAQHAIAAIKASMKLYREVKDRFAKPLDTGYRDALINVVLDSGLIAEVQVHVRPMIMVKDLGSMLYSLERVMPPGAKRTLFRRTQRELYGAAFDEVGRAGEATKAAKSSSETSMPSRATRPQEKSEPVIAERASSPPGKSTMGKPSTSTSLEPTGLARQSKGASIPRLKRIEDIGGYQVKPTADGGVYVFGDHDEIRSLLPEGVRGRLIGGGVAFTATQAAAVKAALAGEENVHGRAGEVGVNPRYAGGERKGQYIGAPAAYNTPAKIPRLRRLLLQFAREGEPGRFWYEASGRAVLDMVGGDLEEARKLVSLLAIYSPQAKVDANSTFALRAWAQYKAGKPIKVKTGKQDQDATEVLYEGKRWGGEKTNNFYRNLMRAIDAEGEGKASTQGVTVDMWMMRAAGYDTDSPTKAAYRFVENETARLARELGWEPQQVQAAIWVGMKARLENESVKKKTVAESLAAGYSVMTVSAKGGKVLKVLDAPKHRRLWLDNALALELKDKDTATAKFDFSDGLRRHMGQVSWEARPGRASGLLPGIHDAPYSQQAEFQKAIAEVLTGANGEDLLARRLGILFDGRALAPGVWQSDVGAGMQSFVPMAPIGGKDEAGATRSGRDKFRVDPAQAQALNTYADILGLVLNQEAVGWHKPFFAANKADHNGIDVDIGRVFTPEEARAFYDGLDAAFKAKGLPQWEHDPAKDSGTAMISSATGMRIVKWVSDTGTEFTDNKTFRAIVDAAVKSVPGDGAAEISGYAHDGELRTGGTDGEDYRQRIAASGSSDVLGWAESDLAPQIQAVYEDFSSRYGWGKAGGAEPQAEAADTRAIRLARAAQAETEAFGRWFGDSVVRQDGFSERDARLRFAEMTTESASRRLDYERSNLERYEERATQDEPERVESFWKPKIEAQKAQVERALAALRDVNAMAHAVESGKEPLPKEWARYVRPGGPKVMYHATNADFSEFRPGHVDAIYTAESAHDALDVTNFRFGADMSGRTIMPVYVKAEKPWDFRNEADARGMAEAIEAAGGADPRDLFFYDDDGRREPITLEQAISFGNYHIIESASAQAYIKAQGHDGFWEQEHDAQHLTLAVYKPEQLKSAIGNVGTFDPDSRDIRLSTGVGDDPVGVVRAARMAVPSPHFTLPEFGVGGKTVEALQDRYNRWKQVVTAVREQGGAVTEASDFYRAEERYWGKVGSRIEDFHDEVGEFIDAVARDGLTLRDVQTYAYAMHAQERNKYLQGKRAAAPSGFDSWSGMSDDDAQAIIDQARVSGLEPAMLRHQQTLQKWIQGTRDIMLDEGLITDDQYVMLSGFYANYVPLRGRPEDDPKSPGVGQGFNIRGKETQRARGRYSEADNVIEHIIQDRVKSLVRAGKNEVLRTFLQFVLDNPDPNLWEVNAVEKKPVMTVDDNGDQVIEEQDQIVKDGRTVSVKDGGREVYIKINDEKLLEQMRNLNVEQLSKLMGYALATQRLLARMYTSLSPVFTVLNWTRDVAESSMSMISDVGFKGAARFWTQIPLALAEAARAEFSRPSADYQLFRATGGKTGFFDFKTIDDQAKELSRAVENAYRSPLDPRVWGRQALDLIESINAIIENSTRFAVWKAARASGKSLAESSSISKNASVNFNRKGTWTPQLSAWFLFFNPAVQGTARIAQSLKSPKVLATLGAAMTAQALLALSNASMGDDDDGVAWWDKIPEETKNRNIVIVLPPTATAGQPIPGSKTGRYIKIPLPYGWNWFATISRQMADLWRNAHDATRGTKPAQAMKNMLSSFLQGFLPVNEVGTGVENTKSLLMAPVPTIFKPVAQALANTNSFGRPLYPDDAHSQNLSDASKFFPAQAGTIFQKGAQRLNSLTGGNMYKSGAVDITPGTLENLVRAYGGGPASFALDLANAMYARQSIKRPDLDVRRLPFIKQVYGEIDAETDRMVGYDRMREIQQANDPIEAARKAGERELAKSMVAQNPELYRLGGALKVTQAQLGELRKRELAIVASPATDAVKYEKLQGVAEKRRQVMHALNEAYARAVSASTHPAKQPQLADTQLETQ